jgi:hypothetical protein
VSNPANQSPTDALTSYLAAAANSLSFFFFGGPGREIVGKNNVGEVTFSWGTTEETKVLHHNLWWSLSKLDGTDEAKFPLSNYDVLLGQSNSKYPKPTY